MIDNDRVKALTGSAFSLSPCSVHSAYPAYRTRPGVRAGGQNLPRIPVTVTGLSPFIVEARADDLQEADPLQDDHYNDRVIAPHHRAAKIHLSPRNFPEMLRQTPNWVTFKLTWEHEKQRYDKYPVRHPQHGMARSNDSRTWGDLDYVLRNLSRNNVPTFTLSKELGVVCIDLDCCYQFGGPNAAAKKIMALFDGTYVEKSASGNGVHIFVLGDTEINGKIKLEIDGREMEIEVYSERHFICMTGNRLTDGKQICDGRAGLAALEALRKKPRAVQKSVPEKPAVRACAPESSSLPVDYRLADIRRRLKFLDSSSRDQWLEIAFILKRWGTENDCEQRAWEVFDDWSRTTSSGNYDESENRRTWESISDDYPNPLGMGTLVKRSEEAGYVRPPVIRKRSPAVPADSEARTPEIREDGVEIELPSNNYPITESAPNIFRRMAATRRYFYRGGAVCEIGDGELRPVGSDGFRSRVEELGTTVATIVVKESLARKPKLMSKDIAKALMESKAVELLPKIELVASAPVLYRTSEGSLIRADSGYCPEARIYVKGEHPEIQISAEEAATEIEELFVDYQFVSPGDKVRAMGFLISVALQTGGFIANRRCPVFVVEANQSQGGKGYMINMVSAVYNETPVLVAQRDGGVGSFDESFQQALIKGRPILCLDNLRGRIASTFIEAAVTAPGKIGARTPGRAEIDVDPQSFVYCATSNGMESTPDLANRSLVIRIIKQPENYVFRRWPEGDLIEHIRANQPRLLAGIHALIAKWYGDGALTPEVFGHDFRDWHRVAQAVINTGWPGLGALIDAEHRQVQTRVSDPAQSWIREVCKIAPFGQLLRASEITELCEENDIAIPRCSDEDPSDKKAKRVGMCFARLFGDKDELCVDRTFVRRYVQLEERYDGRGSREVKKYEFETGAGGDS